jgi:hypothetical protein
VNQPTQVPVERYIAAMDAAEMLWTAVANASNGDWSKQSPEWQEAARRWRDAYLIEARRYQALMLDWPIVDARPTPE